MDLLNTSISLSTATNVCLYIWNKYVDKHVAGIIYVDKQICFIALKTLFLFANYVSHGLSKIENQLIFVNEHRVSDRQTLLFMYKMLDCD